MDDDAQLVELGRRARERIDEQRASELVVPALDDARRRAMLLAVGVDPSLHPTPVASSRSRVRVVAIALAVAAIAAAAVLWSARAPEPSPVTEPKLAVIYDLELAGGRAERLAAPELAAVPRYRSSDALVVRMRPRVADPGPRVLSLRARPENGGAAILVPALVTVDDGGMLELQAPLGELLPVVPGRWQLEVGVGLPGACEQDSEQGCTWVSTTIEIVDGA